MLGSRKPDIQQCVGVLHTLLDDIHIVNGATNTRRDKHTLLTRALKEGFCFLSKALPALGKCIDRALLTSKFEKPNHFRSHKRTALPCLFRGLLRRVFDDGGTLLADPDKVAIAELRQLCFAFYKYETDFTPSQLEEASRKFKEADSRLPDLGQLPDDVAKVLDYGSEFLEKLFSGFDPKDIVPSHGPGIVASGEKPHEKRIFSTKYRRIHSEYPYYRYFYVNPLHLYQCARNYWERDVKESGINKVLFVPKDSRGPRTIACEPLEYQFVQQGLRKSLYRHLETHPLTRGRINFEDQTVNQRKALEASLKGSSLVTVDLKDASDSVSVNLVEWLFQKSPSLLRCLMALRTGQSVLPTGEIVHLKKYAAMGSALCFPIEALVFYTLIQGLCKYYKMDAYRNAFVYGDDIIIDKTIYDKMVYVFESVGLQVNRDKSCTTGLFRESCGADYYDGHDVTYLKVRDMDSSRPQGLASMVALSNNLFDRGYYFASAYLQKLLAKFRIPIFDYRSGALCYESARWPSIDLVKGRRRFNKSLQIEEYRLPVLTGSRYEAQPLNVENEYGEYLRKLTTGWSEEFEGGWYAKRTVKTKYRWLRKLPLQV